MIKKRILCFLLLFSFNTVASVTLGGTRVIYEENKKESNISVSNQDSNSPVLIQAWAENFRAEDSREVPFIVTPPLFRLEPEQDNIIRIIHSGGVLPQHEEKVYWLSVRSIPSTKRTKENKLLITVQNRIKIIYRPSSLSKKEAGDAYKKIKFSRERNMLVVSNPTPFYVSFYSLSVGEKELKEADMVAPKSKKQWAMPNGIRSTVIKWQAINDYGGVTEEIKASL